MTKENKMTKESQETEDTLKGVMYFILGLFIVIWLGSLVPDIPWFQDNTPICTEGRTPVPKGNAIVCVKE